MDSVLGAGVTDAVRGQATRPCYSSHVMSCSQAEPQHITGQAWKEGSVAVENSQDLEFVRAPS